MGNAADIMLPALRRALHSFTKRADIIIRQLSYLNSQQNTDLLQVCKHLKNCSSEEFEQKLNVAAEQMATVNLQLIDPAHIKLQERKQAQFVHTAVNEDQTVDEEAQREILIQQLLDQAFSINNQKVREYVLNALRSGQKISSRNLPIDSAHDLLAMAHIIEVGAVNNLSTEYQFTVEPTGRTIESEFYREQDEFTIELKNNQH
jgi:hypothetical protein